MNFIYKSQCSFCKYWRFMLNDGLFLSIFFLYPVCNFEKNKSNNKIMFLFGLVNCFVNKIQKKYFNMFFVGQTEIEDEYDTYNNTLWLDMSWFSRRKRKKRRSFFVPCELLLSLRNQWFYVDEFPSLYTGNSRNDTLHSGTIIIWTCSS